MLKKKSLRINMKWKTTIATISGLILTFTSVANAALSFSQRTDIKPAKFTHAPIIFNGSIEADNSLELIESLEKLNHNYPALKDITLYINSYGGDMDSGYMLFQAVKSSAIPVVTVNLSMTASAATLMYCAAKQRLVMPAAMFLLHPASVENINRQYLKPDELARLKEMNDRSNQLFKSVYKKCTNLSDSETDALVYSESSSVLLNARQAVAKKMATGITDVLKQADISLTISDEKK